MKFGEQVLKNLGRAQEEKDRLLQEILKLRGRVKELEGQVKRKKHEQEEGSE